MYAFVSTPGFENYEIYFGNDIFQDQLFGRYNRPYSTTDVFFCSLSHRRRFKWLKQRRAPKRAGDATATLHDIQCAIYLLFY